MKRVAFIALSAVVAIACHSDRGVPAGPSALIEDGNHDGNRFFSWLPPLLQQDAPSGQVFSKQVRPTITVTNLCTNNVIRTLAGSDVQVDDAAYHANWQTSDDNLDVACTYRLTVSVGSQRLGTADVDVVDNGDELRNVNTNEYIPLLDGRTLPIKFFVGVGSLCDTGVSDCGEAIARPGVNTTIVTTSGRAGLFVPGDAVTEDVTVTIQSVDNPPQGGCIPALPAQYSGMPNVDNSCYDYHAKPLAAPIEQSGRFKFSNRVTVGICPPVNALEGSHAVLDLLQIFQFDDFGGGKTLTQPLNNVPAPFLRCDPTFSPSFGSRGSILGQVGRALASLIGPRPLYASTRSTLFDLGAGGSTDAFSRFTWALPMTGVIDFGVAPDGSAIAPGTVINSLYSHVGVTFSRTPGIGSCQGTAVYANTTVSLCAAGTATAFSEQSGTIVAHFTVPVEQVCLDVTPLIPQLQLGVPLNGAFLDALGGDGGLIGHTVATATQQTQHLCITQSGIAAVRFAGAGSTLATFDNLSWSRIATP